MSSVESVKSSLLLSTDGSLELGAAHLLNVFVDQRRRFISVIGAFDDEDWAAPTRCPEWSAHEVVRHLCDATKFGLRGDKIRLDRASGFDPRVTPNRLLAATEAETPGETVTRLNDLTDSLQSFAEGLLEQDSRPEVILQYGKVDWFVYLLHTFWDSWIHERDVLLTKGLPHRTSEEAAFYVTAYSLFLSAAAAFSVGNKVEETLKLGGVGAGTFCLDNHQDHVRIVASMDSCEGEDSAEVVDALAGRGSRETVLSGFSETGRKAMWRLADFFHTPVEPIPAS